jgi:hypothetical protein
MEEVKKKGIIHTYVDNEKVYLKKDWSGWRVVEPLFLKDENGKIDWKTWSWRNFFSKKGFVTLAYLLILLLLIWLAVKEQIVNYHNFMRNPCKFCTDCQSYAIGYLNNNMHIGELIETNFSNLIPITGVIK